MKKHLLMLAALLLALAPTVTRAQYTMANSLLRRAVVVYDRDSNGFFLKNEERLVDEVPVGEKVYAFDKAAANLYVRTANGNYEVTLTKAAAKSIKKNPSIPLLTGDLLATAIENENAILAQRYDSLNSRHRKDIAEARRKAVADSMETLREKEQEIASYRAKHKWDWVPTGNATLTCTVCQDVSRKDTIICMGATADSIYYISSENLAVGILYPLVHRAAIPEQLKSSDAFARHVEAFKDSLEMNASECRKINIKALNELSKCSAFEEVEAAAPYGYFNKWGWNNDVGVSFNFEYTNTNKRTIRYIDVFWIVKNDVGDIRGTGDFSGTGPVKTWESASWNWDSSHYFVAGDASTMNITKVVITYMDGTKRTLTGSMIKYD